MPDELILEVTANTILELEVGTPGPPGKDGADGDGSGGGGGATGFSIGTTTPTADGEYLFVQTDGNGNFIDLIVGKN